MSAGQRDPQPLYATHTDLERNILAFCRVLRDRHLLVTPTEVVDALRTAEAVDLADRTEMKLALRTVLTGRHEDLPVFDATFDGFWHPRATEGGDDHFSVRTADLHGNGQQQPRQPRTRPPEDDADQEAQEERDGSDAPQYSPIEVLAKRSFISFAPDELAAIRRAIALVARRLALQRSRRYRAASRGRAIDLRRTFRRNIKYGGTLVELARKRRTIRKPRIVLLCDVSRSMELYSTFLLLFIYALQHTLGKVESFVFSTRLTRVTDYFKAPSIQEAVDRMAHEVPDWAGGTRIGDSLRTFNRSWASHVLNRRTIVLILSDGLDSGEASVLGAEMQRIERVAARVVWLNPLIGGDADAFQPRARTMRAALQHVAIFASAHNLESLQALGKVLTL